MQSRASIRELDQKGSCYNFLRCSPRFSPPVTAQIPSGMRAARNCRLLFFLFTLRALNHGLKLFQVPVFHALLTVEL